ncbi:aliphatic sulfonate ABC transporter substrate-binding protein [Nonomuraea gerenzanensis]|uniref:ABC-type nitrate/sulfonate/bicarbonate transport systems, periplasmic components n=1 Tax=Nonomuraea gerenzanensis TaxID=93944 RepID=A0A1M4E4T7_9ACTN|nr:aliphatic sulfonate ABC transporter substrate-binding protein [Nonomuraea gerenzanensis]UBU15995.1 aliphatic sulfonate ABC transporter substrate-binding protein [Nonomuraea gerenzanensis]SBO93794.1 ABC-type nitrate/sulfonate/bicarbonate transport systems, periplasmic components [Nonomuraea gerenzanensis]
MRSLRRALTAATAVSLLALSVTACSDDGSTVRFGYISDYNGASLLAIAENQGLWEKQGLTPEIKVFTNGPLQIQALGAGDLDFGYIGPGAMWLPATGKAKVVAINTLAYADRVIGRPGIKSIADLKGKKVGVPEGTSGEMVLNLALQKAGMSPADIEKVPMDPATVVSAFVAGQIDGAGIWYPLIDNIKQKVPDLTELASTKEWPDNSFPTAFVGGTKVSDELTDKVIKVLQEANDWRAAHHEESITEAASLLKLDAAKVKADAANVTVMTTQDLVNKTKDGTVAKWLNSLGDFFVSTGKLKTRPEPATYYTGDLYTKAFTK